MQLLHIHCEIITIMRLLDAYITSHNYHFERFFFFFFACVVKNIENPIFNIIQIYNKVLLPIAIILYIRFTEHNHFITGSLYLQTNLLYFYHLSASGSHQSCIATSSVFFQILHTCEITEYFSISVWNFTQHNTFKFYPCCPNSSLINFHYMYIAVSLSILNPFDGLSFLHLIFFQFS